jgi:Flagellar hook-length control protein FliK
MITREPVIKPLSVNMGAAHHLRGKSLPPEVADVGYFRDLAKGSALRAKAFDNKIEADENGPLQRQADDISDDVGKNEIQQLVPEFVNFNVLRGIDKDKEMSFRSMGQGKLVAHLSSCGADELVKNNTAEFRNQKIEIASKLVSTPDHYQTKLLEAVDKKAPMFSAKVAVEQPRATPQKQDLEFISQPALALPFLEASSFLLQHQMPSLSNLPHVSRVEIEKIKRNVAGELTSLELVLEPAELGRITARLQHESGKITLILNTEHKAVAEELMRDAGLLMRVLGDHISGVEHLAIFVQIEGTQIQASQEYHEAGFSSGRQYEKDRRGQFEAAKQNETIMLHDGDGVRKNTTKGVVLI